MPDPNNDAPPQKQDSKDFIEQLRLVHFTLVVICLALVVISLSPSPTLITKAQEQLRQITDLARREMADPDFFRAAQMRTMTNSTWWKDQAVEPPKCPNGSLEEAYFDIGGRQVMAKFELRLRYHDYSAVLQPFLSGTPKTFPPGNLEDFRRVWDANVQLLCATALTMKGYMADYGPPFAYKETQLRNLSKEELHNPGVVEFYLVENDARKDPYAQAHLPDSLPEGGLSFRGDLVPDATFVLPIKDHIAVPVDFRAELRARANQSWRRTEFKDAFYELDQATTDLQRLNLTDLALVLQHQEQKTKENFEAFGIKFPVEATTRWGVLLILGIQLYFWLHLAEYRRRALPLADIAWIGAYPQLISRLVFFATSAVAPVAVIAFLLFFQREQTVGRLLGDCALLVSGIMAAISWHQYRRSNLSATNPIAATTSHEARSASQGKG